jgi:hypothetical protein
MGEREGRWGEEAYQGGEVSSPAAGPDRPGSNWRSGRNRRPCSQSGREEQTSARPQRRARRERCGGRRRREAGEVEEAVKYVASFFSLGLTWIFLENL